MKKWKRFLIVFVACVITSMSVIGSFESARNQAQASEVVLGLTAYELLINLGVAALAGAGIYVTADELGKTQYVDMLKEKIINDTQVEINNVSEASKKICDYASVKATGMPVDWSKIGDKLSDWKNQTETDIVAFNKSMADLITIAKNGGKLPKGWKFNKDFLKGIVKNGIITIAAVQAVSSIGNLPGMNYDSIQATSGYTAEWYNSLDEVGPRYYPGTTTFSYECNDQGSLEQRIYRINTTSEKVLVVRYVFSNVDYFAVVTPSSYSGDVRWSGLPFDFSGNISDFTSVLNKSYGDNDFNIYVVNGHGINIEGALQTYTNIPSIFADITLGNNAYNNRNRIGASIANYLRAHGIADSFNNYDDWYKAQKHFFNDLFARIGQQDLSLHDLANLLRQIMGQIGKIAPTLPTQPTLNPTNPITDPVSNIIDDYDPVDEDDDDIPDDPEPPVIDPIDPIDPVDPENPNPNNLRLVQWSNFFPFCIPFDLFAALKLLRAKPQDPIWEIPIHLGYKEWVLIDYTLVIDLTSYGFSEVWAVVRTGEVIGFIFLLGVITKKFVY